MKDDARKPRLLVLTSTYPRWRDDPEPGFVHELSKRLVADFDVTVLAPHARGAAVEEEVLWTEWRCGVIAMPPRAGRPW